MDLVGVNQMYNLVYIALLLVYILMGGVGCFFAFGLLCFTFGLHGLSFVV